MSLFGNTQSQSGSLFGSSTQQKPSPFGAPLGQQSQPQTGSSLFGGTLGQQQQSQPQTGGSLFGGTLGQQQQSQPQTGSSLFGGTLGQQQQSQPQTGGSLFGGTLGQQQPQQQTGGLFGQKPQGSLFGGGQQQSGGLFSGGQPQQQQQQQQQPQQGSLFGGTSLLAAQQQQQQQNPGLGQSLAQLGGSSLWEPGRAVTGVHRDIPTQIRIVQEKWDATSRASPFRTHLYNNVGEELAPFFQPGVEDDENKWEDALRKRPSPDYVPVLVRGFFELGKRAQRQKDFLAMMQARLHEINNCLTDLLSRHDLKISVKIADCRRKHLVLSKRCLTLAAKTQVLRNRGYAMDDAEEELKKKLTELERSVFDPSLNGRAEEVWARMLAIREHAKRLQMEMERAGPSAAAQADNEIDENTMKTAKKILDDYHAQIQHLQKELAKVRNEFEEAQKLH